MERGLRALPFSGFWSGKKVVWHDLQDRQKKIRDVKLYHVHKMSRECQILDEISPSLCPPGVLGIHKLWSSQNSCPNPTLARSGLTPIRRSLPSMTDPWRAPLKEDLRARLRILITAICWICPPWTIISSLLSLIIIFWLISKQWVCLPAQTFLTPQFCTLQTEVNFFIILFYTLCWCS